MNILAFHFGHDSAIALIRDGHVVACQLSERIMRRKHFIGINEELLTRFLSTYNVQIGEIDCCALTSTQREDLYIETDGSFDLTFARHQNDRIRSDIEIKLLASGLSPVDAFLGATPEARERRLRRVVIPHAINPRYRKAATGFKFLPWMDYFSVGTALPYAGMREIAAQMSNPAIDFEPNMFGFHYPATATVFGRAMPCYVVHHHAAHAASAYYLSGQHAGLVMTTDGGSGLERGGWWYEGRGTKLMAIAPHYLEVGGIYAQTAKAVLHLGSSADGKMMGLAPYGAPTLFDENLVGNAYDYEMLSRRNAFHHTEETRYGWERYIRERVGELGYDVTCLGDPDRALDGVNADIAASVQRIFEGTMMQASDALATWGRRRGLGHSGLSLAGGSMLNCPTNTQIHESGLFADVFIPPFTDDSGCAIGAGLWVCHNLFGCALIDRSGVMPVDPYLGNAISSAGCDTILQAAGGIRYEKVVDAAAACAADLAADRIVAWFEGRSEIGPRALGHRSILADARPAANWERVNRVKHRETWRPFAPMVLKEHSADYFEGAPANSPYMLFNARVKGRDLPAVTHVDGTSRIQTVTPENGAIRGVLEAFHRGTGCPVVMNTSLNGPGEPIIETPAEALRFAGAGDVDVLYLDGWRIEPTRGSMPMKERAEIGQAT